MTAAASPGTVWRTSSHSGANGDCVEVARSAPGVIAIRDSKNLGGSALTFPSGHWTAFTAALKKHAASQER